MFQFRRPFDKSPFILCVVGEHFRSEGYFAGAPRRNVAILFGHHLNATTEQDNEVQPHRTACSGWFRSSLWTVRPVPSLGVQHVTY
jgi:hypothetical protein